jgi:uncharacterized integral membrane protein (TIGR00697 family)|tara:strand:+ start:14649 stop:15341 length:693 start_codon:yes stop_codon:yes gene_type:complete
MCQTQKTELSQISSHFLLVSIAFVTCLVVSNIIAVKLIDISGYILTGAIVIFPVTYIIGDILTEVYGYSKARQVIWLGFIANSFAVCVFAIVGMLPAAEIWNDQKAYDTIFGATPRILIASMAAYLVGEFANSYVLAKLKILTHGRFLWVRTIGSTLVGQSLDSIIFIFIAFSGILQIESLLMATVVTIIAKSGYEALATPITYIVVNRLKKKENLDTYDLDTRFNPFVR